MKRTSHITILLAQGEPKGAPRGKAAGASVAESAAPEATEDKPKRASRAKKKEAVA
jgi:hypothetical protein